MSVDESERSVPVATSRSFGEVLTQTAAVCGVVLIAPVVIIVLVVGGDEFIDAGSLIATGIAIPVVGIGVTWFRYRGGAAGFPRRHVHLGDRVREWLVLEQLESGVHQKNTFLVRHGREYGVLKVTYHGADDLQTRRRAQREAAYLGQVNSPHVVSALGSWSTPTATYLVTRYVGGETLRSRRAAGSVTDEELYSIAMGALRGLDAIHRAGIRHGDVTPLNIIADSNGAATVIDLGIARANTTTQMTTTRSLAFTIGYRAPEQFEGSPDPKSDIFALAATLYYLATGVEAFAGDEAEIQSLIRSARMPDMAAVPRWLRSALVASFTRSPAERPSALQVMALLDAEKPVHWVVHKPTSVMPTSKKTRSPSWLAPSSVLTLVVLLMFTVFLQHWRSVNEARATGEDNDSQSPSALPVIDADITTSTVTPTTDSTTTTTTTTTEVPSPQLDGFPTELEVVHWAECLCTDEYGQVKVNVGITNVSDEVLTAADLGPTSFVLLLGPFDRAGELAAPWVAPSSPAAPFSLVWPGIDQAVMAVPANPNNTLLNSGDYVSRWDPPDLAPGTTYLEDRTIDTSYGPRGSDLVFNVPPDELTTERYFGIGFVIDGTLMGVAPARDWGDSAHGASF